MSAIHVKTGGADGADAYWADSAIRRGHFVEVVSFKGHARSLPRISDRSAYVISEVDGEMLASVGDIIKKTALKRAIRSPGAGYVYNLVARNYFIVDQVDAVFAVGYFSKDYASLGIDGGTGWGCEYYVAETPPESVKLFLFDQEENRWNQYNAVDREWVIPETEPKATNYSKIAVIGSRRLTEQGRCAIDRVWTV